MKQPFTLALQAWYLGQARTGLGRHTQGMVEALAKKPAVKLKLLLPERPKDFKPGKNVELLILPLKRWIPSAGLRKWVWERFQVPRALAKLKPSAAYFPYPSPLPAHASYSRALTVHDRILWDDPRYQGACFKRAYHSAAEASLAKVDVVFAVSETVRGQLPRAKLLPNALTLKSKPPRKQGKPGKRKILLYWGGFDVRKQVPALASMLSAVHQNDPSYELWILGQAHHASALYPKCPNLPGVRQLGSVSDKKLWELMGQAHAMVHASDSEGFNLPILEAMAGGLPCLLWDHPVNREVSGGHALFFKSFDPKAFSAKLKTLQAPKTRDRLLQGSKAVLKRYSWDSSASILLSTLQHAEISRPKSR